MDLPFWVAIPVVALLIPITAIITEALQKMKEREHQHRERLKAMEMGLGETFLTRLESEPPKDDSPRGRGAAFYGAIWTGIGGGLLVSTTLARGSAGDDFGKFASFVMLWAFPALGIGLALLIYGVLTRNGRDSHTALRP